MIEITSHRQGAILNHNHGIETESSLKIKVEGISEAGRPVKVNGVPAEMDGRIFRADVDIHLVHSCGGAALIGGLMVNSLGGNNAGDIPRLTHKRHVASA